MRRPLAAGVAALIAAGAASAGTITIGHGVGVWRLGQRYVERPGLVRSELVPANDGVGCVFGPGSASRVDYYRVIRAAWRRVSRRAGLYLIDVATMRAGDRSSEGFVIAQSRLGEVRSKHPDAVLGHSGGRLALGATSLTRTQRAGKETFKALVYWFDARGIISALETYSGGC